MQNVKGPVLTLWVMLSTDQFVLQVPCTAELENWCVLDLPPKHPGPLKGTRIWGTCLGQAEAFCCLCASPRTGGCGWAPEGKGSTNKYGPQVFSTSLKCDDLVKDQESEIETLGTSLSP